MQHFIPIERISEIISSCIKTEKLIPDVDTLAIFYDFDELEKKVNILKQAFPGNTKHTSAIKANPLIKVLQKFESCQFGLEAASEGEIYLAEKIGFQNDKIVFDSPVKTISEIQNALTKGYHINADSFIELERIETLKQTIKSKSLIGLRINPQVGIGKIEQTSVAGEYSKFGVPVKSHKREIIESFKKYCWLKGIHLHIGSQACELEMLLKGFELALQLITEINKETSVDRIEFIDIGGGIPVSYYHDKAPESIIDYGHKIQLLLKQYQLENIKLITEFGRFLHANSGFIVSQIEYVKEYSDYNTLMIHGGADILVRECLNPGIWHHEISLLKPSGEIKNEKEKIKYHIAGPLCFAGDIVAKDIILPKANEGDIIVIHDTGGYTFGMWSKYVSRLFPKVIAFDDNHYEVIRKRENPEDIYRFWSDQ